jgi:hypothetical protein
MAAYELSWITDSLAMGHAPMSFADLDSIRKQGVQTIINLCAEFCDLHEIEEKHGFEVFYLPVCDDEAPSEPQLEQALEWLDEAIYLGKKVLVHCRYGMGRTATLVAAYLLRKGFGLKIAKKKVEEARTMHSSFSQWRLLRKYSKKSGRLTLREPSLEGRRIVDLSPFFGDYEALLGRVDELFQRSAARGHGLLSCGRETDRCCYEYVGLSFAEAAYLHHKTNKTLSLDKRKSAVERAVEVSRRTKEAGRETQSGQSGYDRQALGGLYRKACILCPLSLQAQCLVYPFRPIACRTYGLDIAWRDRSTPAAARHSGGRMAGEQGMGDQIALALESISANMLYALSSVFPEKNGLTFPLAEAVSGRFIQKYFESLIGLPDLNLDSDAKQPVLPGEQVE